MPKNLREKSTMLIVTALAFFLSLEYSETMTRVFDTIYPLNTDGLFARITYTLILTVLVVYAIILVERGLDGK